MTPQSSGVTRDTFTGRVDDIAANIGRLQRGEALQNVTHQSEAYSSAGSAEST